MNNVTKRGTAINIRSASFFEKFRIHFPLQNSLQKASYFHLHKRLQICFFSLSTERVITQEAGAKQLYFLLTDAS
ncbi:hypothetical protein ACQCVK_20215 [Rossellomorea vietnamensis]|uniref:hypothetical protein n=1 Tax=Rossellomorea vietnamensis TaxID=218284 RepID=UPI003CF5DD14